MQSYPLSAFKYTKEYATLRGNTREIGRQVPAETIIIGERETKLFHFTGADEGYNPIAGECLVHHYRSECNKFFAYIEIV